MNKNCPVLYEGFRIKWSQVVADFDYFILYKKKMGKKVFILVTQTNISKIVKDDLGLHFSPLLTVSQTIKS